MIILKESDEARRLVESGELDNLLERFGYNKVKLVENGGSFQVEKTKWDPQSARKKTHVLDRFNGTIMFIQNISSIRKGIPADAYNYPANHFAFGFDCEEIPDKYGTLHVRARSGPPLTLMSEISIILHNRHIAHGGK